MTSFSLCSPGDMQEECAHSWAWCRHTQENKQAHYTRTSCKLQTLTLNWISTRVYVCACVHVYITFVLLCPEESTLSPSWSQTEQNYNYKNHMISMQTKHMLPTWQENKYWWHSLEDNCQLFGVGERQGSYLNTFLGLCKFRLFSQS